MRYPGPAMTYCLRYAGPDLVRLAVAVSPALITAVVAPGLPASVAPRRGQLAASPSPAGPPSGISRAWRVRALTGASPSATMAPTARILKTLIERWNGTSWSVHGQPNPARRDRQPPERRVVSEHDELLRRRQFLDRRSTTRRWWSTGTAPSWSIVASPNPSGATGSLLNGMSCPSATSCFAVGTTPTLAKDVGGALERHDLVDRYHRVPTGAAPTALSGVSCPSTTSCFAVGYYFDSARRDTLGRALERHRWSIMPSPNPSGADIRRRCSAVSCRDRDELLRRRQLLRRLGVNKTLVEHWNGRRLVDRRQPEPERRDRQLPERRVVSERRRVATPSALLRPTSTYKTLIERWNGTSLVDRRQP